MESTLLLIIKDNKILLAQKKKGFGEGKFNGVGGKLEKDETPEEAMLRETMEEIGVTPLNYEKWGEIKFSENYKGKRTKVMFHLYVATDYDGTLQESDEMVPHWFDLKNIPYDKMFLDDKYWLPFILNGKKIKAFFDFDDDWNLRHQNIEEVSKL